MRHQFLLLLLAAVLGAVGAQAVQSWLHPTPAYAGSAMGRLAPQADGSLVINARNTTLTLTPDGVVRVTSPEQLVIGAADDVKIEGYRVTIDASSEFKVETQTAYLDTYEYKLEGNHIQIGESGSDIKLADGSDPICVNDDGKIVKSERVKSR
jgi:hypothetical protein